MMRLLVLATCLLPLCEGTSLGFDNVINIPPALSISGLQSNSQVNVLDGANLSQLTVPSGLSNVEVNVLGGHVSRGIDARNADQLTIAGGAITGQWPYTIGKSVRVTGGEVRLLSATRDLAIEGGSIDSLLLENSQVVASVSGGSIARATMRSGAAGTFNGGRIGSLHVTDDAGLVALRGGDFRLNGVPVSGKLNFGGNQFPRDQVLTGVFEDGSSFVYQTALFGTNFADLLLGVSLVETVVPDAAAVINLPTDPVPNGLRSGQILNSQEGVDLGDYFHAYEATINLGAGHLGDFAKLASSELVIDGGSVGDSLLVLPEARVELRDGSIQQFRAAPGSEIVVLGGRLGDGMPSSSSGSFADGASIRIGGGEVVGGLDAYRSDFSQSNGRIDELGVAYSSFHLTGGRIDFLRFERDSTARIEGGTVGALHTGISAAADNVIDVHGGRIGSLNGEARLHGMFEIDGAPAAGEVGLAEGSILTGTLSDGTPLVFSSLLGDQLRSLHLVAAEPPPIGQPVIVAPGDPVPNGLRSGQTLTLGPGSDAGDYFVALNGVLNVAGGSIGDDAVVSGGVTSVSAGEIGAGFKAVRGARVLVSGGSFAESFNEDVELFGGSSLTVSGGSINTVVELDSTSRIDVTGGHIRTIGIEPGATARFSGDASVGGITTRGATEPGTSTVEFEGGDFGGVSLGDATVSVSGGNFEGLGVSGESTAVVTGGAFDGLWATDSSSVVVQANVPIGRASAGDGGVIQFNAGTVTELGSGSGGRLEVLGAGVVIDSIAAEGGEILLRAGAVKSTGFRFPSVERNGFVLLDGASVAKGVSVSGSLFGTAATFEARGGSFGRTSYTGDEAVFRLVGGEFQLNGAPVAGNVNPDGSYLLTGTLADGSPFILSSEAGDFFSPGTLQLQVTSVPSVVPVINAPAEPVPFGIRSGQVLNMADGAVSRDSFTTIDATLNLSGGRVGDGLDVLRSTINVTGGEIGERVLLYDGSVLNLNGGSVGPNLTALSGASVNLAAGVLGDDATFEVGSAFTMTGGATSPGTTIHGTATVSGGILARGLTARHEGTVELVGAGFELDGVPTNEGGSAGSPFGLLAGVLQDGTPVIFERRDSVRYSITEVEVAPPSASVINAPADPTPQGLRPGQVLNLGAGASTPNDFTAIDGVLNVVGGSVGSRLEALRTHTVLKGGTIADGASLYDGSILTVVDGAVESWLSVTTGASLGVVGGSVGFVQVSEGGVLNVAGGDFVGQPDDLFGQDFWSLEGSETNLFGLSFTQDGIDLLDGLDYGESVDVSDRSIAIEGMLADGSALTLSPGGRGRLIGRGSFGVTKLVLGDFNLDGVVDASDYTVWRDSLGATVDPGTGADHDFDGQVTARDQEIWASHFGSSANDLLDSSASGVPEPSSICLGIIAMLTFGWRYRS